MNDDHTLWVSLPTPALFVDEADKIIRVNPAAEGFFNLSARHMIGQSFWECVIVDAPLEAAFARTRAEASVLYRKCWRTRLKIRLQGSLGRPSFCR